MLVVLLVIGICFVFWFYRKKLSYWEDRGIPGPKPEFFWGNLRQVWSYDRPRSLVLKEWTQTYGKIYGIQEGARKMLVVSDLDMMQEILVKKFDCFYARARFPLERKEKGFDAHLIEARGAQWKRQRALGSHAFTNEAMKEIRKTVDSSARILVQEVDRRANGGIVDITEYFQEYTMHIICNIALGKKDVKMFDNKYIPLVKGLFGRPMSNPLMAVSCLFPSLTDPFIRTMRTLSQYIPIPSSFLVLYRDLFAYINERKKQREAGQISGGRDFIDMFLDAEVDGIDEMQGGKRLHPKEVLNMCIVFLIAGYETTASSLSYISYFLATHSEVQDKMVKEIDEVCPDEEIEYDQLRELNYMECAIRESLRHYPLGSVVVSRECMKDVDVCGYKFTAGDMIQTDTWSMHMDKEIWGEDAEDYRPERWLEESSRSRIAFQAFGEGPRICIGMRLAFMEEKIALIHLLRKYRIENTSQTIPLHLVGSITVAPAKVNIRLVTRHV